MLLRAAENHGEVARARRESESPCEEFCVSAALGCFDGPSRDCPTTYPQRSKSQSYGHLRKHAAPLCSRQQFPALHQRNSQPDASGGRDAGERRGKERLSSRGREQGALGTSSDREFYYERDKLSDVGNDRKTNKSIFIKFSYFKKSFFGITLTQKVGSKLAKLSSFVSCIFHLGGSYQNIIFCQSLAKQSCLKFCWGFFCFLRCFGRSFARSNY